MRRAFVAFLGDCFEIVYGISTNNFPLHRRSTRLSRKVFLHITIDELRCDIEDHGNKMRRVEVRLKSEINGVMCILGTDDFDQKSMCQKSSSHDAATRIGTDRRTFKAL